MNESHILKIKKGCYRAKQLYGYPIIYTWVVKQLLVFIFLSVLLIYLVLEFLPVLALHIVIIYLFFLLIWILQLNSTAVNKLWLD